VSDEVHSDDRVGGLLGLVRGICHLYAAAFAPTAGVYLGFYYHRAAEFLGYAAGLLRRFCNAAARHGDSEFLENFLRLIFVDFHLTASQ